LAKALAEQNCVKKIKQLKERENQQCAARKICYLQEKLKSESTTMVIVKTQSGQQVGNAGGSHENSSIHIPTHSKAKIYFIIYKCQKR